jgi:hypothetical protein
VTVLAGNGTAGYSGDSGPAAQATLSYPSGVSVDAQGNVYIAGKAADNLRQILSSSATGRVDSSHTIQLNSTVTLLDGALTVMA